LMAQKVAFIVADLGPDVDPFILHSPATRQSCRSFYHWSKRARPCGKWRRN
jgi:hypothetical protein